MSAPSSETGEANAPAYPAPADNRPAPHPSGQVGPLRAHPRNLRKPLRRAIITVSGLVLLALGIAIGDRARKRFDRWAHGFF